jgi:hypothetical protein
MKFHAVGPDRGGYEEFYYLGYNGMKSVESQQTALLATFFTLVSSLAYSSILKMEAVCWLSTDYTALYPRRHNSSVIHKVLS